jgi:hypothetical protein
VPVDVPVDASQLPLDDTKQIHLVCTEYSVHAVVNVCREGEGHRP